MMKSREQLFSVHKDSGGAILKPTEQLQIPDFLTPDSLKARYDALSSAAQVEGSSLVIVPYSELLGFNEGTIFGSQILDRTTRSSLATYAERTVQVEQNHFGKVLQSKILLTNPDFNGRYIAAGVEVYLVTNATLPQSRVSTVVNGQPLFYSYYLQDERGGGFGSLNDISEKRQSQFKEALGL